MGINSALTRGGSNPILAQGGSGAWDEGKIGPMQIVKMGPTDYRAWYEGYTGVWPDIPTSIGYATSTDGTSWTKYGSNPVMTWGVAWENEEVSPGTVMWDRDEGIFKMWYHGGANPGQVRAIGYATSSDGISWTKYASNPILTKGTAGQWDDGTVNDCCVIKIAPGDYRMWYKGESGGLQQEGYATSTDGISWTKYGSNPVFSPGTAGQWDDNLMYGMWVVRRAREGNLGFHAWYAADSGAGGPTSSGIGYAFSADGISWVRGANNPVLVGTTSPEESVSDPICAYEDPLNQTMRIVYYYDDFGASPIERSRAEASVSLAPSILTSTESVRTDTSDPYTFNVTPQGLPRGVAVSAVHGTSSTDHVAGVTYGGVALTRFQRNTDTATEPGASEWWFLGNSIPTGTQTVSVDLASATTDDIQFVCVVLYSNGNMEVIDQDGVNENAANPSVTLQYGGRTALALGALYGGGVDPTTFTPNANCVTLFEEDLGAFFAEVIAQTTPGSADFAIGGTAGTDDVAFSAIAVAARGSLLTNPQPLAHLRAR